MITPLGPATLYVWWSAAWATVMRAFGLASMIYWVDTLGFDPIQLVVLGTGLEAAVFVAEIPTGVVADTRSRKLSLIVSHVVIAVGVIAAGLTGNFWVLVATQVCWGVGWTFKSGADVAWVTDELGDQQAADEAVSRAGQWTQFGSVAGILIGGGLGVLTSYETVIVASGIAMLGLGAAVAFLFPEHEFERGRGDTWAEAVGVLRAGIKLVRLERVILGVFLATLLIDMGSEAIDRLSVKQLDELGFPDTGDPILWLMGLNVCAFLLAAVLLRIISGRITGVSAPRRMFAMALGLAIVAALLLASAPSLAYGIAGALLFRSASSVIPVVGAVWVNRQARSEVRATLQSFLGQAGSLGEVAGGLLLGGVAQAISIPIAFYGSALFFCLSLYVVVKNRPPAGAVSV